MQMGTLTTRKLIMGCDDGDIMKARMILRHLSDLKPNLGNPRTHSKRQIKKIAASIREFGFNVPVLVDKDGMILAGHGRVEAAKLLGHDEVPTICVDHLTSPQARAFALADNRLAEIADWDEELLKIELEELLSLDLDFSIDITGFEMGEIDNLLKKKIEDDDPPLRLEPDEPVVSRFGDLWLLGQHRVLCGDAREPMCFDWLMGADTARMVFTDPPYNVRIAGNVAGKGRTRHSEFAMASGEMSEEEFINFLESSLRCMADYCCDGALAYVFMDWRHVFELSVVGRKVFDGLKSIIIWAKDNPGLGSLYKSQHEMVFLFAVGKSPHVNNVQLGRFGRNRSNLWQYPGMSSLGAEDRDLLQVHPTVKPTRLIADAILDCTNRGDIVLDSFLGAGSTILAAERTGRRCRGMEIEGRFVDATVRRWEEKTGLCAIHADSGLEGTSKNSPFSGVVDLESG